MTVHLRGLVNDMRRYLDLATFDVVVNLEGEQPTFHGRIRAPATRKPEVDRFLANFQVTDRTWTPVGYANEGGLWLEATFPVIPYPEGYR